MEEGKMSKGDFLIGKKTIYKKIEFKSKLESRFARFLDRLNIQWEYEPTLFLLQDGTYYKPDFYLPELKTWVEVKGLILEHNEKICMDFAKENNTEILLISEGESSYASEYGKEECCLGKCQHCNAYYFYGNLGDFRCRKCSIHEGDHNCIFYFKGLEDLENKIGDKNGDGISEI
jgi:hypothetical protein